MRRQSRQFACCLAGVEATDDVGRRPETQVLRLSYTGAAEAWSWGAYLSGTR